MAIAVRGTGGSVLVGRFPGWCLAAVLLVVLTTAGTAASEAVQQTVPEDLTTLGLQELLKIKVTSVAKVTSNVSRSPAAIFVLSQDDIRRSGATCIPEALRLVPGVNVARIDANKWAISIRGINSRFFNKLLVLIDGRTVYDPLQAGVYWDAQDTLLEDVERIEIIRGPGAALWGANAVTGVINVITRSCRETRGGLATAIVGNEEKALGSWRFGAALSPTADYRVWAKGLERDDTVRGDGSAGNDGWSALRAGFRVDWERSKRDLVTFDGSVWDGKADYETIVGTSAATALTLDRSGIPFSGQFLRGRWQRTTSPTSDWALQFYYDHGERRELTASLTIPGQRDTYDLDFQRHRRLDDTHDLVWGLGYRLNSDSMENVSFFQVNPLNRDYSVFSAFVQDRIQLDPERLELTLGSRFEHNDFTGFEIQPTARLLWTPNETHTAWAAVSRAVRTPARLEHDLAALTLAPIALPPRFGGGLAPVILSATSDSDVDSEKLISYELGYRVQAARKLSVDVAAFYERFLDLFGASQAGPAVLPPPALIIPFRLGSTGRGSARGFEVFTSYAASERWKLGLGFSNLSLDLNPQSASTTNSPHRQFQLRSYWNVSRKLELDNFLTFVDKLEGQKVPEYFRFDAQLTWHARPDLDLSLVGQNLFDDSHPEFGAPTTGGSGGIPRLVRTEIDRSLYARLTWRF